MKLSPQALKQLIKEELEVILTDDEAAELFGDQFKERLVEIAFEEERFGRPFVRRPPAPGDTRMYSRATDEKVPGYRGWDTSDEKTQVSRRNASGTDRRSQDPRRSEPRSGTRTRRGDPRRNTERVRRAKDAADKVGRKWVPRYDHETQVTFRRQGPEPAPKAPAMPPGSPDPSGLLKQAAAAQRQAKLAAIKTTIKKYGAGALTGADLLFAIESGYLGGLAAQAPLSHRTEPVATPRPTSPALMLPLAAFEKTAPLRKKIREPWIVDAPEYIQSGEGYIDPPRHPDDPLYDPKWTPEKSVKNAGGWGITDIDPSAPITKYIASQLRGQPEATPVKRMVGGEHVPASQDPEYLAKRQAQRNAGMRAAGYDPDLGPSLERAEQDRDSYVARESLTPANLRRMVMEELGFGERRNHRRNKMARRKNTKRIDPRYFLKEDSQLELPGMETPALCEPADGVDGLSSQLAQMVVDSGMPPEELNDLMELIYDKVAADLEGIGIEDEEDSDDYRRTTIGFMEALRKATLNILAEHAKGLVEAAAGPAYVDPSGESVPEEAPKAQDTEIAAAGAEGEAAAESQTTTPAQNAKQVAAQEAGEEERKRSNAAAMAEQKELARYTKLAGIHGEVIT